MIQAVIFDMDGLMFDTERLTVRLWKKLGVEFGYPEMYQLLSRTRGVNSKKFEKIMRENLGDTFPVDAVLERTGELTDEYVTENGVPLRPGLFKLLEYLRREEIPAAVATSTSRKRALRYLELSGAAEYFSSVVCGDMVERSKPDPDIYLKAARALNKDPRGCMALEDSYNGCLSAAGAGMKTVMVPDLMQPDESLRKKLYACVAGLTDVIPVLETLKASGAAGQP